VTGAEFAALMERLGWSVRDVARRFQIGRGTVHDMRIGRMTPDPIIADYLAAVADAIDRVPMPDLPLPDRRYHD
jgi:hypothetical protein